MTASVPRTPEATTAQPRRRPWRIAAGVIAPFEALIAATIYVIAAPLLAPTIGTQVPLAVFYAAAVAAFVVTSIALWRSASRPVRWGVKVAVLAAWAAHIPAVIYLLIPSNNVGVVAIPVLMLLIALVIGSAPLLQGSER